MESLDLLDGSLKATENTPALSSAGPLPISDVEAQMAAETTRLMAENKVKLFFDKGSRFQSTSFARLSVY